MCWIISLGYSPRVCADRMRVANALEELRQIRRALGAGAISYSAARELVRVATPETEHAWLDHARDKAVRSPHAAPSRQALDHGHAQRARVLERRRIALGLAAAVAAALTHVGTNHSLHDLVLAALRAARSTAAG